MKADEGKRKEIGLAVVGSGTIGRIRAVLAKDYPGVGWLGVCDINESLAKKLAEDAGADFYTTDHRELLKRSEVNAAIIATEWAEIVGADWKSLASKMATGGVVFDGRNAVDVHSQTLPHICRHPNALSPAAYACTDTVPPWRASRLALAGCGAESPQG